ncbi:MAG: PKD domain-containing protein, partial [Bacteroidota bacterium]
PNWPPEMQGKLFFFDFSGWIRMATIDEAGHPVSIEPFVPLMEKIICLEQNPVTNAMYYLGINGNIRQITFGGNPPPAAVALVEPQFGASPLTVTLDASSSFDQNHAPEELAYRWDFGDGTTATGQQVQHTFSSPTSEPTSFGIKLQITDPEGAVGEDSTIVSLNNTPPSVTISSFADGDFYPIDKTNLLELRAEVFDQEHAPEVLDYEWQTYLHHNDHFHPEPVDERLTSHLFLEPLGCQEEIYFYRVRLRVTDPEGLFTELEQRLYPDCQIISPGAIDLIATTGNAHIDLNWQLSSSATDILSVEVQRSSNFTDFIPLANITSSDLSWRDESPIRGNNIYRIKTISANRTINYSSIATASWPTLPAFTIAPNPTDGVIQLRYGENFSGGQLYFTLYDAQGQLMRKTNWQQDGAPDGFTKALNIGDLPAGIYIMTLTGAGLELSEQILHQGRL